MAVTQRTTTPPKQPPFEPPELVLNEPQLYETLSLPINAENFNTLIASNFLLAMDARDRKLTRDVFEEVLVVCFNLQNRLVRIAELNLMLENLKKGEGFGTAAIQATIDRRIHDATVHRTKLLATLRMFQEMRGPEDSVS